MQDIACKLCNGIVVVHLSDKVQCLARSMQVRGREKGCVIAELTEAVASVTVTAAPKTLSIWHSIFVTGVHLNKTHLIVS